MNQITLTIGNQSISFSSHDGAMVIAAVQQSMRDRGNSHRFKGCDGEIFASHMTNTARGPAGVALVDKKSRGFTATTTEELPGAPILTEF